MIHTHVMRAYEPLLCTQSDKQGTNIHLYTTYFHIQHITYPLWHIPPTHQLLPFDPSHHPTNKKPTTPTSFDLSATYDGSHHRARPSIAVTSLQISQRGSWGPYLAEIFACFGRGKWRKDVWNCPLDINIPLEKCFGYVLDMFLGSKYIKYLLSGMSRDHKVKLTRKVDVRNSCF